MNYNGHRMEIENIKSRVLAAFVRANPGIVGCVRFKYRKLELSLVGKWSREEQEWSEGMSPEKVKGSPRQLFLSERHATLLVVGGGGALRDGTRTAARETSEEEASIPIL